MEIRQYSWDVVDSNSWLIVEEENGLLIDVVDSEELFETVQGLRNLTVILTHAHFDHIAGLNKLRELKSDTKVICTQKCSEYLDNIYRNMSATATVFMKFYKGGDKGEIEIEPFTCDAASVTFIRQTEFRWRGHEIRLEAFCGHSDDGLIAILDGKYMFSGAPILPIPPVTKFPCGSTKRFWQEDIPRFKRLDVNMVYPGHGRSGRLEDMIAVNKMPERYRGKSI